MSFISASIYNVRILDTYDYAIKYQKVGHLHLTAHFPILKACVAL